MSDNSYRSCSAHASQGCEEPSETCEDPLASRHEDPLRCEEPLATHNGLSPRRSNPLPRYGEPLLTCTDSPPTNDGQPPRLEDPSRYQEPLRTYNGFSPRTSNPRPRYEEPRQRYGEPLLTCTYSSPTNDGHSPRLEDPLRYQEPLRTYNSFSLRRSSSRPRYEEPRQSYVEPLLTCPDSPLPNDGQPPSLEDPSRCQEPLRTYNGFSPRKSNPHPRYEEPRQSYGAPLLTCTDTPPTNDCQPPRLEDPSRYQEPLRTYNSFSPRSPRYDEPRQRLEDLWSTDPLINDGLSSRHEEPSSTGHGSSPGCSNPIPRCHDPIQRPEDPLATNPKSMSRDYDPTQRSKDLLPTYPDSPPRYEDPLESYEEPFPRHHSYSLRNDLPVGHCDPSGIGEPLSTNYGLSPRCNNPSSGYDPSPRFGDLLPTCDPSPPRYDELPPRTSDPPPGYDELPPRNEEQPLIHDDPSPSPLVTGHLFQQVDVAPPPSYSSLFLWEQPASANPTAELRPKIDVPSFVGWSVISTVIFPPLGVIALIMSLKVCIEQRRAPETAWRDSSIAHRINLVATFLGILAAFYYVTAVPLLFMSNSGSRTNTTSVSRLGRT